MTMTMRFSGPLQIDSLTVDDGGTIGLVHCPGRCIAPWQRDLTADLAALEAWGAVSLVSLVEGQEFVQLGVPQFAQAILASNLGWHHIPIPEHLPAGRETLAGWRDSGPAILSSLRSGDRLVLHCSSGIGRSSTIAAKILVELGQPPLEAVERVRQLHPGSLAPNCIAALASVGPALTND